MFITYKAKLLEKKELAPHVNHIKFSYPEDPNFTFTAGQYMIFHIPQGEGQAARRQYSILSNPSQKDALEFIIEYVENGVASQYLASANIGVELTFQGPAGVFTYRENEKEPIYMATGTGIVPIYSMIQDLLVNKQYTKNIHLFWGLKLKGDMYFFNEIKELCSKYPNFHFQICLSRESELSALFSEDDIKYCMGGHVDQGLEEMVTKSGTDKLHYDYYLCGSKHVVESLREYLDKNAIPKEQVYFEKFTL